jgi:hypothetical protein
MMAILWRFSLLEESRNGNLPFLEDRGTKESIPRGPWGISRNGMIFHSTHFSGFTGIFGIIICIITENTNLWDKNSIMIKKFQCLGGFFFLSNFFMEFFQKMLCFLVFLRSSRNFGEDPRT